MFLNQSRVNLKQTFIPGQPVRVILDPDEMMIVVTGGDGPIKGGLAGSTVLNAKVPLALDGNFKPGFRIELHIKDLANALDTAHELGGPVPLASGVMEIMQALKVDGKAGDDHGGIIQFYERLAKVQVRRRK